MPTTKEVLAVNDAEAEWVSKQTGPFEKEIAGQVFWLKQWRGFHLENLDHA